MFVDTYITFIVLKVSLNSTKTKLNSDFPWNCDCDSVFSTLLLQVTAGTGVSVAKLLATSGSWSSIKPRPMVARDPLSARCALEPSLPVNTWRDMAVFMCPLARERRIIARFLGAGDDTFTCTICIIIN